MTMTDEPLVKVTELYKGKHYLSRITGEKGVWEHYFWRVKDGRWIASTVLLGYDEAVGPFNSVDEIGEVARLAYDEGRSLRDAYWTRVARGIKEE